MYTKIIQRGALIVIGLLFIVPLALKAQTTTFSNTPTSKVLKSVVTRLWLTDAKGEVMQPPFIIPPGVPFTINWSSKGIGVDGFDATDEIVCKNNWNSSTRLAGSATGSITAGRTFHITCMGVGAGWKIGGPVAVGAPDLIVSGISLGDLKTALHRPTDGSRDNEYLAGEDFTISATIKNIGNAGVTTAVETFYLASKSPDMTNTIAVDSKEVAGVARGASVSVPPYTHKASASQTDKWYFQACVDPAEQVFESKENNNCSQIKGPYIFVNNY